MSSILANPGADSKASFEIHEPLLQKNINRFDLIAARLKPETSGKAKGARQPEMIVYGSSIAEKPDIMARKMSGAG